MLTYKLASSKINKLLQINWHRPWLPLKNPYERYIIFSFLVLLCSFVHCIIILFNLGFSVFAQVNL